MLYETAARAQEVLRLNVEDLDPARKRATTVRKGGDLDVIHWQTGTARLLPHVISGRTHGPLFLSDRPPAPSRAPAALDLDEATGRAQAVLPAGRRDLHDRLRRGDPAPVAAQRPDAPGRGGRPDHLADGEVAPRVAADPPALRPAGRRGGGPTDGGARSATPPLNAAGSAARPTQAGSGGGRSSVLGPPPIFRAAYVIFPVGASAICERAASPGSDSRICEALSEL